MSNRFVLVVKRERKREREKERKKERERERERASAERKNRRGEVKANCTIPLHESKLRCQEKGRERKNCLFQK